MAALLNTQERAIIDARALLQNRRIHVHVSDESVLSQSDRQTLTREYPDAVRMRLTSRGDLYVGRGEQDQVRVIPNTLPRGVIRGPSHSRIILAVDGLEREIIADEIGWEPVDTQDAAEPIVEVKEQPVTPTEQHLWGRRKQYTAPTTNLFFMLDSEASAQEAEPLMSQVSHQSIAGFEKLRATLLPEEPAIASGEPTVVPAQQQSTVQIEESQAIPIRERPSEDTTKPAATSTQEQSAIAVEDSLGAPVREPSAEEVNELPKVEFHEKSVTEAEQLHAATEVNESSVASIREEATGEKSRRVHDGSTADTLEQLFADIARVAQEPARLYAGMLLELIRDTSPSREVTRLNLKRLVDASRERQLLSDPGFREALILAVVETVDFHDSGDIVYTAILIDECLGLPGPKPAREVEDLWSRIESTPDALKLVFAVIPRVSQQLARQLASRSLEHIKMSSTSQKAAKANVKRLLTICRKQKLLDDRDLCRAVTVAVVDTADFEDPSDIEYAAHQVSEYVGLPGVESLQEVESILGETRSDSEALELLVAVIPRVEQGLANGLAGRSVERIKAASPSQDIAKRNLQRLLTLCQAHGLLADPGLGSELALALAQVGEFQDAKTILTANDVICESVAVRSSTKTPGFALDVLHRSLALQKDQLYSEVHSEILTNIVRQLAKCNSALAREVCVQSLEIAHELARDTIPENSRLAFYRQIQAVLSSLIPSPARRRFDSDESRPNAVQIVLDADFETFVSTRRELFITSLADMLRISPDEIHILEERAGSVIYILVLENGALYYRLKGKFDQRDQDIREWENQLGVPVKSIQIVEIPELSVLEALEWIVRNNEKVRKDENTEPDTKGCFIEINFADSSDDSSATIVVTGSHDRRQGARIKLPFDKNQVSTILKALEIEQREQRLYDHYSGWKPAGLWKPAQMEILAQLGLVGEVAFAADYRQRLKKFLWDIPISPRNRIDLLLKRGGGRVIWRLFTRPIEPLQQATSWQPNELGILRELELFEKVRLTSDRLKTIGNLLYQELLAADTRIGAMFSDCVAEAQAGNEALAVQVSMDRAATHQASHPWELVSNQSGHLLLNRPFVLDLARSTYSSRPAPARVVPSSLNILYVEARPDDQADMPLESKDVEEALEPLKATGLVEIEILSSRRDLALDKPTVAKLYDRLKNPHNPRQYHVIHFDGHGRYGCLCPKCDLIFEPNHDTCRECGTGLLAPQGFLYFETEHKRTHRVSTSQLMRLLDSSSIRLVVLSACSSARIYGDSLLSSPAPALLELQIPAVVGFQFAIRPEHSREFTKVFYESLVMSGNVRRAVNEARRKLHDQVAFLARSQDSDPDLPASWYIPVLYLRSKDTQGQVFEHGRRTPQ